MAKVARREPVAHVLAWLDYGGDVMRRMTAPVPETNVVNIRGYFAEFLRDPRAVYCGRTGLYRLRAFDYARLPAFAQRVAAPNTLLMVGDPWGNRFRAGKDKGPEGRRVAIARYAEWLGKPEQEHLVQRARRELVGKMLGCWCAPEPCHCHILRDVAGGWTPVRAAPVAEPGLFDKAAS